MRRFNERELAWTAQKHAALVPASAREVTKIWTWPEPPNGAGLYGDTRAPVVGTLFTWDGDVVAEEGPLRLDGSIESAATRWHYEPEGFRPLAKQTQDDRLQPISNDHLGTPHEMFDERGQLKWAANHTTWGAVRKQRTSSNSSGGHNRSIFPRKILDTNRIDVNCAPQNDFDCPLRFQGQWADEENGLYFNRNRYFDPDCLQYISPDPLGLDGGSNPQSYVTNPKSQIDPFGLSSTIDSNSVRFSQNSAKSTFKDGRSVSDLIKGLKDGSIDPKKVDPIRILRRNGKTYTLDNRRLYAFQQAGKDIPYRWATPNEISSESWKFTTTNDGTSIRMKP